MQSVATDGRALYVRNQLVRCQLALPAFWNQLGLRMKTPQRTFVVEFKSSRRQPKTLTNSIWGDTDLKALAREVEDQASDLDYSGKPKDLASSGTVPLPGPADIASSETIIAVDAVAGPPVGSPEAEGLPEFNPDHTVAGTAAQIKEVQQPRLKSTRRRSVERGERSAREDAGQGALSQIASSPASLDEIAALDAENKRLKLLLAEHLRKQNVLLKQMLGRFDLS